MREGLRQGALTWVKQVPLKLSSLAATKTQRTHNLTPMPLFQPSINKNTVPETRIHQDKTVRELGQKSLVVGRYLTEWNQWERKRGKLLTGCNERRRPAVEHDRRATNFRPRFHENGEGSERNDFWYPEQNGRSNSPAYYFPVNTFFCLLVSPDTKSKVWIQNLENTFVDILLLNFC